MFEPHDHDPGADPAGGSTVPAGITTRAGTDTDGDGVPDTLVLPGTDRVWLAVDTDGDDLADLLVRVDDQGMAETFPLGPAGPLAGMPVDELLGLEPLFEHGPPSWPHWPT